MSGSSMRQHTVDSKRAGRQEQTHVRLALTGLLPSESPASSRERQGQPQSVRQLQPPRGAAINAVLNAKPHARQCQQLQSSASGCSHTS